MVNGFRRPVATIFNRNKDGKYPALSVERFDPDSGEIVRALKAATVPTAISR